MSTAKAVVGSKKAERILLTGQLMESQVSSLIKKHQRGFTFNLGFEPSF